jgi:aryl-alcohol dehydrogenase-like predicted oxidoreductase
MYSIPANKDTYGSTERIIGTWLKKSGKEKRLLASKIAGPNPNFGYMREKLDFSP